jgi:recombinational DNA repair ATPase RecF
MRIHSIRIRNYKSYRDVGPISLGLHFNVIVGQNNSGKTAFLEALDTANFDSHPHKRLEGGKPVLIDPQSRLDIEVAISGPELEQLLLARGGQFSLPIYQNVLPRTRN